MAQKAQAREARLAAERTAAALEARRRRWWLLGAVVVVAAAIVLLAALTSRSGTDRARRGRRARLDVRGRSASGRSGWVRRGAPVVVEEYADPQCPFCADFAMRDLPALVSDYVRPGKVQMRLRLLTFLGPDSVQGGGVAAAAGLQNRQWDFVESFYARQGEENSGYVDGALPARDGLRGRRPRRRPRAGRRRQPARSWAALREAKAAALAAGVQSTPIFRVGRRGGAMRTVGADGLRAAIDAAVVA